MAKSYTHLTPEKRYYIKKGLRAGDSHSETAPRSEAADQHLSRI